MSALWAVADVMRATGASTHDEWCAWRVEIDSRKVQAGDLFVALKGENFDGHDYVEQAFAKGAIAAIVEKRVGGGGNQLIVPNSFAALDDLAKYNRLRVHNLGNAKIVGITGSVGKTSTKEMLRLALSVHGKVHATSGNYNNHIGTPLNLANMPLDVDFAVFEMGMNHVGEISHLTHLVCPHIALITRVEAAHLEFFADVMEIAKAKAEIFECLDENGVAIINADQPYFQNAATRQITFGENENANCSLFAYSPNVAGCKVSAEIFGQKLHYKLAAIGRHWAVISLSVLAVCHALGLDLYKSAPALANFSEVEGRGKICQVALVGGGEFLLINDSYNASPASMRAAFAKLAEVWGAGGGVGRKVAILGNMLELGKNAGEMHAKLADDLLMHSVDVVYSAGDLMQNLQAVLPEEMQGAHAENVADLLKMLVLKPQDVVLVKGSHGSKMYELAQELLIKNKG
jgi:UDP-N-acetylmuramoyl-tripeptide--D-alanyl-D-alanine ligase